MQNIYIYIKNVLKKIHPVTATLEECIWMKYAKNNIFFTCTARS